jgi:hypothetical protein
MQKICHISKNVKNNGFWRNIKVWNAKFLGSDGKIFFFPHPLAFCKAKIVIFRRLS